MNLKEVEVQYQYTRVMIDKLIEKKLNANPDHLRNYLLFLYGPVSSYLESIIILLKHKKFNAAKVILRSLVEAHIKATYYQVYETEKSSATAAKECSFQKLKTVKEFGELLAKHPSLQVSDDSSMYNPKKLDEMRTRAQREIDEVVRLNDIETDEKEPDLKVLAMKCDSAKVDQAPDGHFLEMYTLIYRYLSPVAHLNILGLQHFFQENPNGHTVYKEDDETSQTIAYALGIWVALVKDLFENKVILASVPADLLSLEESIKKV